jgi:hypothetical protein
MSVAHPEPAASWKQISDDWKNKSGRIKLTQKMANATLRKYSCAESPGWNLHVSDQIRADVFLKEFGVAEREGKFSDLTIIYLPQDHCSGTNPGQPTPSAMVADNDLAVGRIVDAISHSQFWRKTCIFAIEDDPQSGFDHVDGHRSTCLAISPYTKRGAVVSAFYNQTSVLHTMELMLGCPPMNQFDAMAPAMGAVFTSKADATPYTCVANKIPLDQMNPEKAALSGAALKMAEASEKLPLELPDQADENTLNRIVWFATKGADAKYPAEFAGAHGRGLKKLHLKLGAGVKDDDDD